MKGIFQIIGVLECLLLLQFYTQFIFQIFGVEKNFGFIRKLIFYLILQIQKVKKCPAYNAADIDGARKIYYVLTRG